MPAVSVKQRRAMAIAEHHPDKVFARNKGLTQMSHQQLHDFASTPEEDLPEQSPVKKAMKKAFVKGKKS